MEDSMKRILWGLLPLAGIVVMLGVAAQARSDSPFDRPAVQVAATEQATLTTQDALTPSTSDEETVYVSDLPDYGPAPEISNESWLNVDQPLRLAGLRGKVVLMDMWTFDCINCIHIIPSVRDWHEKYSDQGLVVIGNHFPEFSFEHDIVNIQAAIERLDVPYTVAQDNDGKTWNAYSNRYWPTVYLIDKNGHLRYRHIGEGAYDETEAAIQDLLKETYIPPAEAVALDPITSLAPTTTVNVRSGPGEDHDVIGSIQQGESFVVRGEENGWYRIQYNDGEGYVSGDFVTVTTT
jgi:thiol-disulfide isomerase/thioredoxin